IEQASELGEDIKSEVESYLKEVELDVINKRNESSGKLYSLLTEFSTNWYLQEQEFDLNWAELFLDRLQSFNGISGIFLSHDVTVRFHELTIKILGYKKLLKTDEKLGEDQIIDLFSILSCDIR
ncbi:hypothetical protein RZS08_40235, partial [Arthrospira platensis SPKY1]|nr:hypothetical protein [Arthrospira platensis SPKY1]